MDQGTVTTVSTAMPDLYLEATRIQLGTYRDASRSPRKIRLLNLATVEPNVKRGLQAHTRVHIQPLPVPALDEFQGVSGLHTHTTFQLVLVSGLQQD